MSAPTARWLDRAPADWDALVAGDPSSSPSHRPAVWEAFASTMPGCHVRVLALEQDGVLVGGLPAIELRRGPFRWLHALPAVLPAPPLALAGRHAELDPLAADAVYELARELRAVGGAWSWYRSGGGTPDPRVLARVPGETRIIEASVIELGQGLEAALARVGRKERAALRRPRARALAFSDDPARLETAYALHVAQSREWGGHRPLPLELSRRLLAAGGAPEPARLFSLADARGVVSAALALDGPHETFVWWSGTHAEGRARGAFTLLLWRIVEWAAARGRARVNLGASDGLPGVSSFKRSLGAEAVRYPVRWLDATHAGAAGRAVARLQARVGRARARGGGRVRIATLSNAAVVHTRRWVEHLRGRGHDVRLWSLEAGPAELDARPLPSAALPGVLRYPLAVPALARELRAFAPDLVDAHFVPNYGLMGALSGVRPLSVAAWGSDLLVAGSRDVLQRARARWVLRRAGLVIADADNLAAAAIALGAPRERVRAIPWGIDRGLFVPAAAREPGLLLSTRMHEEVYDIPTILRGVALVMARRPGTFLAIAGQGSLRPALEREAARLLPAGRFRFLGRLTPAELAGWLGRAEVCLSASRSDSTSLSLLETMAAGGLPVVSDIAGNREWVADGDGARLFPCGDAGALAGAVESALSDPAWAALARERNARVVEARGDWHRNFARIEACFEALAAGRPLPSAMERA